MSDHSHVQPGQLSSEEQQTNIKENSAECSASSSEITKAEPSEKHPKTASELLQQYWNGHFAAATKRTKKCPQTDSADEVHNAPPPSSSKNSSEPKFASPLEDWIASPQTVCDCITKEVVALDKQGAPSNKQGSPAPNAAHVLVLGCGTSRVSEMLYTRCGFRNIVSTDISSVAIEYMKENCPVQNMAWLTADCTALPEHPYFAERLASFDVCVDKGTADTLLFRTKKKEKLPMLRKYFESVAKCIRPSGLFCIVSPRKKIPWLNKCQWFRDHWILAKKVVIHKTVEHDNMLVTTHVPKGAYLHVFRKLVNEAPSRKQVQSEVALDDPDELRKRSRVS